MVKLVVIKLKNRRYVGEAESVIFQCSELGLMAYNTGLRPNRCTAPLFLWEPQLLGFTATKLCANY